MLKAGSGRGGPGRGRCDACPLLPKRLRLLGGGERARTLRALVRRHAHDTRDGSTAHALCPDDVYSHYVEAASFRFIGDRFMFLDASTLGNLARRCGRGSGFAFMNSHRTGGISASIGLPFGGSSSGRYEEFTDLAGFIFTIADEPSRRLVAVVASIPVESWTEPCN